MSRIPPHATRVFKGVIFDVYQWEQELFDGTTTTFEALRRPDTVMVIALDGEDVLYTQEEQPGKPLFLSLFGGRREEGETALEAAKRELREESGLVSEDWEHLRDDPFPGKIDWTVSFFIARGCRQVGTPMLDGGEKITVLRAPLATFIKTVLPRDDFLVGELKREILCALDVGKAEQLEKRIRGS